MIGKVKFLFLVMIGLIQFTLAIGQDTLMISKDEILTRINSNNLQIKISEKEFESAHADYRQSNALFLPTIQASHTAIATTNPLMAFGSKLNQEVLTPEDFNPDLLNNPERTQNFATLLEVTQPLFNLDGLYERKAAKSKMDAYQLQFERTREYLELEVSKAYMQLQLAYRAVDVMLEAHSTASASLALIKDYYEQGMLQKADVLDMQIRFNEVQNQWQNAKSNVQNASDYLAFLMDEEDNSIVYFPIDTISTQIESQLFDLVISDNRKDIQAMQKSSEAYENMFVSSKNHLLPRINAFGSYQLYDDKLFGTNAQGYLIGAQLSWTLFDGYTSIGKIEKSKVDYHKSTLEVKQYKSQSQLELNKSLRQLYDAENRVRNSKLAHEQSQESYRIRKDRFIQGLVKTSDLLMSETQMSTKELEYLQAVFEYNMIKEYISFLTK